MELAFNIILNVLLIGAMALFAVAVVAVIVGASNPQERAMRAAAAFCGALIVLGAQAAGVSYADFIVKALSDTPTLAGVGFAAAVVPAAAGAGIGWYLVHVMTKSTTRAMRLLTLIAMLCLVQFAAVYVVAFNDRGAELGTTAVPNIAFGVSLLLYFVIKFDAGDSKNPSLLQRLRGFADRSTTAPPEGQGASKLR